MARLIKLTGLLSALFGLAHGADVEVEEGYDQRTEHRQNAVEVQGDGLDEYGDGLIFRHAAGGKVAGHGGEPAAQGKQHAPGGGGGVDNEGGLLVGHLQCVVEGTGDRAGDHAAQGAGGEDDDAEQPGEQVRAAL